MAFEVDIKEVPAAAAAVIQKAAQGATVKELSREERRAEVRNARVVQLDSPRIVYSAELKRGQQRGEIGVLADGTVVDPLVWQTRQQHEAENDGAEAGTEK